jgi:hypothetical protein
MSDCIDADRGPCAGEVFERPSLSGSGLAFARCEHHYIEYAERTQPIIDDINRRYPATAPADFDPTFAGERWDEED